MDMDGHEYGRSSNIIY